MMTRPRVCETFEVFKVLDLHEHCGISVGGLRLPKVLKNTTNMLSKYNILSQEPSALR
jgi:hypothetical protein